MRYLFKFVAQSCHCPYVRHIARRLDVQRVVPVDLASYVGLVIPVGDHLPLFRRDVGDVP
jgi:hypothetical protein